MRQDYKNLDLTDRKFEESGVQSETSNGQRKEREMPREVGERYACEKCGAQLVYEKPCPCPEEMPHSEICCGEQMKRMEQEESRKD